MRSIRLSILPILLFSVLLVLCACSDDDDPAAPGGNVGDPPDFELENLDTYEIPAAMEASADPAVQEFMGYIAQFDWIDLRLARLEPPASKAQAKAGPWVYTWQEGEPGYDQLTYTLTIRELADRFTWELRSTGTRWEVVYDDYLNLAAEREKDGSSGWIEEYDYFGEGNLTFRFSWSITDGTLTATLDVHDPFSPYRLVAVIALDGSGSLNYFEGVPGEGWLWKRAVWDAAGVGTWTEYDSEGQVVDSGSFGGPTG